MRKVGLADDALCVAAVEMAQGLIDTNLGGHVVKKRVALSAGEIVEVCSGSA